MAYVRHAMAPYRSRGALVANIEEAARRRRLARGWLADLLATGHPDALIHYARALWDGDLVIDRNLRLAVQYDYVRELLFARRTGNFDTAWRRGITDAPVGIDVRELPQLTAEARRLYRQQFEPWLVRNEPAGKDAAPSPVIRP